MGKCLACEPGRLRQSGGIPRARSGPAELGDRRCSSWLLSSSRTSRSSWSAESLSATTHYFQWAVSCGGGGCAWGQRAAGTTHLCLGIAASLLSSPGTVRWREQSGKGRRKRGRDKGKEEGRDAQERHLQSPVLQYIKNPSPSLSSRHRDGGKCIQPLGQLNCVTSNVPLARVSSNSQKQMSRM